MRACPICGHGLPDETLCGCECGPDDDCWEENWEELYGEAAIGYPAPETAEDDATRPAPHLPLS